MRFIGRMLFARVGNIRHILLTTDAALFEICKCIYDILVYTCLTIAKYTCKLAHKELKARTDRTLLLYTMTCLFMQSASISSLRMCCRSYFDYNLRQYEFDVCAEKIDAL